MISCSTTAAVTIANQLVPWMPSRSMLDFQEETGAVNLAHILGEEKAEAFLQQLSRKAQQDLAELGVESENTLFQLIQWNQKRTL